MTHSERLSDRTHFDFSSFDLTSHEKQSKSFSLGTVLGKDGVRYALLLEAVFDPPHTVAITLDGDPSLSELRATSFKANEMLARPGTWNLYHRILNVNLRGLPEDIASTMFDATEMLVRTIAKKKGVAGRMRLEVSQPFVLLKCLSRGYEPVKSTKNEILQSERMQVLVAEVKAQGHRLDEVWFREPDPSKGSRFLFVSSPFRSSERDSVIIDKRHTAYYQEQFIRVKDGTVLAANPAFDNRLAVTSVVPPPMVFRVALEKALG